MLIQELQLPIASFELSKLAKQKGFDNFFVSKAYSKKGVLFDRSVICHNRSFYKDYPVNGLDPVLAPTLQLLAYWLNQKHNIGVHSFDTYILTIMIGSALLKLDDVEITGQILH